MPERLSDDLLQKLRDSFMVRSDSTSHGVILAIDELLALRAQLAAGPVMPETPSRRLCDEIDHLKCINRYGSGEHVYAVIRSALADEREGTDA